VARGEGDRGEVELVRTPPGADRSASARRIEAGPAVLAAEPNFLYTHAATSTDPYYTNGSLWGMYGDATTRVNQYGSQAGEAWAAGHTGSADVYVGVIDEGIQFTHPDLAGQVWTNPFDAADGVDNDGNGYVDDLHGWDFAGNNNTIYDGGTSGNADDHGTHVSGTIGAKANTAGVVGVTWNVTLVSGKFLGKQGGNTANAIKALDYFTNLKTRHGLNIVATNNSWGGGGFSQALLDAITRAARQNILFIAAAGNGGRDGVGDNNNTVASYPSNYNTTSGAGYDSVIAVAAITSAGAKADFSNYGATTVDLGAPGQGVWSTTASNTYSSYSGTSMATPHVTGGAALYASTHPGATAATIRSAILSSTVPTASMSGRTATGGRLNVSTF
jgi:subtilisin family serine protease